jgi:hypothetical protein
VNYKKKQTGWCEGCNNKEDVAKLSFSDKFIGVGETQLMISLAKVPKELSSKVIC